jgi:hypothetical protein
LVNIIPNEIEYLKKYDAFKQFLDNRYEMPDNLISLIVGFLEQGNGTLSLRSRKKELSALTQKEVEEIETTFKEIFDV